MAIVNRDLAPSQQRENYVASIVGTASGVSAGILNPVVATATTYPIALIGSQSRLVAAGIGAWGVSGAPVCTLWIYRFAGGFTSIVVGNTLAITAYGTSGALSFSMLPASVSYPLQVGDELVMYVQGANSAMDRAMTTCVIQNLQDIVSDFGV